MSFEPYVRTLPELASLPFPAEPLATCASCAMAPRPTSHASDVLFTAAARCCTYHPRLANYLAGRALRRGGPGAERVLTRIVEGEGVERLGIGPGRTRAAAWRRRSDDSFGRDPAYTCPFWSADAALGCTIHLDRDAVCRSWHCKVSTGQRGHHAWMTLNHLLSTVERETAAWCVAELAPETPGAWAAYYVAAADLVDRADATALARLRTPAVEAGLQAVREAVRQRDADLPDVLQPRIKDWVRHESGISFSSWSPTDRTVLPSWTFELLSRLDGVSTWREATDRTADALGHPIPAELVLWLWHRGLVGPPIADVPGGG